MDNLAPAIGVLGLLALIVGGIMLLPKFRQHRLVAKSLAIGGGIAFVVGLSLTPTPPSQSVGNAAVSANVAEGASTKEEASEKRAALMRNYRETLEIAGGCDRAIAALGSASKSGSQVALYSAAKEGQSACQSAWQALGNIEASTGEKEEKAVETCRGAYFVRQRAMETAMSIADGDAKPSNIVSMQDDLRAGQAGVMLCVAQWIEAGGAVGVKPDEMK